MSAKGSKAGTRDRIVREAIRLLAAGGRRAVTLRAVSAAAQVQPTAIYRQFGDMQGLLDLAAHETLASHIREQANRPLSDDPVEDLRRGWDLVVSFGRSHPDAFALLYCTPSAGTSSSPVREGVAVLEKLVTRIAEAGRLRIDVARATEMVHAAGIGVTLALAAIPPAGDDARLSHTVREVIITAITDPASADGTASGNEPAAGPERIALHAIALRALLGEEYSALSPAELQLLCEWLDRLATERGVRASKQRQTVEYRARRHADPGATGH